MLFVCRDPLVSYKCESCDFFTYSKIRKSVHHCGFRRLNVLMYNNCKKCKTTTFSKIWYLRHQIMCTADENPIQESERNVERKFHCDECSYKAISSEKLTSHFKTIHLPLKSVFECDQCNYKTIISEDCLKLHIMNTHHKFPCNKCKSEFESLSSLKLHQTGSETLNCSLCRLKAKSENCLKMHHVNIHQKLYCDQCKSQFRSSSALKWHQSRFHPTKASKELQFKCREGFIEVKKNQERSIRPLGKAIDDEKCSEGRIEPSVSSRTRSKTNESKKSLFCGLCRVTFSAKSLLDAHLLNVHNGRLYKCLICKVDFAFLRSLQLHISQSHSVEETLIFWYKCQICEFESFNEGILRSHGHLYHSSSELYNVECAAKQETRPFKCVYCPYKSADIITIQYHTISLHNAELMSQQKQIKSAKF